MHEEPEPLRVNGFNKAIIGFGGQYGSCACWVYDIDRCIEILMEDGMTDTEAVEYFDYNIAGAYLGEGTPIFIESTNDLDEAEQYAQR